MHKTTAREKRMVKYAMEAVGVVQSKGTFKKFLIDTYGDWVLDYDLSYRKPDGFGIHPRSGLGCAFEAIYTNPLSYEKLGAYDDIDGNSGGLHLFIVDRFLNVCELEPMAAMMNYKFVNTGSYALFEVPA